MYPPVFETVAADTAAQALLGVNPTRFYPAGEAPQGVSSPYAVWRTVTGFPENYLDKTPDIDTYTIQVEVFASTLSAARGAAEAVRDAVEPLAHIVAWRGESRDVDTRLYRFSFDVDWMVNR